MPRNGNAKKVVCTQEQREALEKLSQDQDVEGYLRWRAQIVLGLIDGMYLQDVAREQHVAKKTAAKWRDRFITKGMEGLQNAPKPGRPKIYDDAWGAMVIAKLNKAPPEGVAEWNPAALARALDTSELAIRCFLQDQGIQLSHAAPNGGKKITCTQEQRNELKKLSQSWKIEAGLALRVRIVLGLLGGKQVQEVMEELHVNRNTVMKWRDRFIAQGIEGLRDAPNPGKAKTYNAAWEAMVIAKLGEEPPEGVAGWRPRSLAQALSTSERAVRRFLHRQGIQLGAGSAGGEPKLAGRAADIVAMK